jgi:hypothetical protein
MSEEVSNFPSKCICGCDHVRTWIEDRTLGAEFWACACPKWVKHIITSPETPDVCCGTFKDGSRCNRRPLPNQHLCEKHALASKWLFDPERATEFPGHSDRATEKQRTYLHSLATMHPLLGLELTAAVDAFNKLPYQNGLLDCTKGEAMFIIKCFTNDFPRNR